jgi:putative endonuclease
MKRQRAERGGRRAERLAALWLQMKGWRILARRARTPVGEVDLVARKGRMVAFVEVKARATAAEADFALDDYRLRRVAAAAEALAPRVVRPGDDLRIDAIFIVPGAFRAISRTSGTGDMRLRLA